MYHGQRTLHLTLGHIEGCLDNFSHPKRKPYLADFPAKFDSRVQGVGV